MGPKKVHLIHRYVPPICFFLFSENVPRMKNENKRQREREKGASTKWNFD